MSHLAFQNIQRQIIRTPLNFVFLAFVSLENLAVLANSDFDPSYSVIAPGLEYANIRTTNQPWSIHIARLDRSRKDFEIVTTLAKNTIQGLSPLSVQAESIESSQLKPIAAVNGDFFLIKPGPYQGDPKGLQIQRGELLSAPFGASFWIESSGQLHLERIISKLTVSGPYGLKTSLGLNETPNTTNVVLFTPAFGASTRNTNGLEIILEKDGINPWLPLRANTDFHARVREIRVAGDTTLSSNTAILSIGQRLTNVFSKVKVGNIFHISTGMSENLKWTQTAIGGGPILVTHGKEQQWHVMGTNALPRHPRSALGWNKKYFFLVEVDGRQKELSIGMIFAELAGLMKQLGCTEAMNLDGGGSATFWLNGKVINSPSDKRERPVANAVVIAHRETTTH